MNTADTLDELLVCRLDEGRKVAEPCTIVIVGASGDLTARKLIPALFQLFREKQLPEPCRIIGFARRPKTDAEWRGELREAVERYSRTQPVAAAEWEAFAARVFYCEGDLTEPGAYERLKAQIGAAPEEALRRHCLFYLATMPRQFAVVAEQLARVGLLQREEVAGAWQRLVVEKPFGGDLASAQGLSDALVRFAHEKQILRIDHYLGKETVQNILMFRFSNAIFEPLWGRQAIDHVQITVSEKLGVGSRGAFYEEAGALRDIVQNHLLQVLALVAMEPPVSLEAEAIRDEKVKLLKAVRVPDEAAVSRCAVRGQYAAGEIGSERRVAYREEARVDPASQVETFVALRLMIENWRWSGVPFYVRSGKALPVTASEVRVQFRPTPHVLFAAQCGPSLDANALTLRLQPDEGITLRFNGKVPGASLKIRPVRMHFSYDAEFGAYTPEAYERLLIDAIAGDATLFIRRDEVEASWRLVDPIRSVWSRQPLMPEELYPAGTWGPAASDALLGAHGYVWRNPGEGSPPAS